MITFTNLTKRFGSYTAVDNLSLQVAAREAVALWGPNGAGKTTAVKCLLGLLAYDGRITVNGFDAKKQGRQARAAIGYVPQQQSFYDDMSTLDTASSLPSSSAPLPPRRPSCWPRSASATTCARPSVRSPAA